MSKTYETGHAKNVANFETLVAYVNGYGSVYNPSNPFIQLTNLTARATAAKTITEQVNNLIAENSNAIARRDLAFQPFKSLNTRILNAIRASNVPRQIIDNAAGNIRKIRGERESVLLTAEQKQKLAESGTIVNQISASQQSYVSMLDSFEKQLKLLATIPQYAPNEIDLQLATLTTLYADLLKKNRDVISKTSDLSTLRLNRNNILYDVETGIVALALDAKNYVKSVFGATSPQFKQISGIAFKTVKT